MNNEYWVSYSLQDGTQLGASIYVPPEVSAYDFIEQELMREHGSMFADIADYGIYIDDSEE